MRLIELNTAPAETVDQAWDAWDKQIAADIAAGKLDAFIEEATQEAESAEAI